MPIRASPFVQETSRKTGEPLGNTPPVEMRETVPLTEIATVGRVAVVEVGVVVVPGVGVEGTAVTGGEVGVGVAVVMVGAGVVVVGVVAVGVVAVGVVEAGVVEVEESVAGVALTWGRNGSFVSKTSNATS